MTQKEIQELIKFVSKSGIAEVEIEKKDFKITVKAIAPQQEVQERTVYIQPQMQAPMAQIPMQAAPQQVAQAAPAPAPAEAAPVVEEEDNYITINSPMIGTFYRASAPDKPVFVEVGDVIKEGDTVCIIEAMKLFNEIESEIKGRIVKVLVDDATPVEYDQPLFLVDPA